MPLVIAEGLIALSILGAGVAGGIALGKSILTGLRARRSAHEAHAPWTVNTRSAGRDHVVVEVVHPRQEPQEIEVLDTGEDDFQMRLYEAQSKARNVALALNSK